MNKLLFALQNYNKYLKYTRILRKKSNLFVVFEEKTCYLHDCAKVSSGETKWRSPTLQQIFVCFFLIYTNLFAKF